MSGGWSQPCLPLQGRGSSGFLDRRIGDRLVDGYRAQQIADQLGISWGAVRQAMQRGMARYNVDGVDALVEAYGTDW